MNDELDSFKKKLLYRASYRGTKEMDILLTNFVKKFINIFNTDQLYELEKFLELDDEIILNYYNNDLQDEKIVNNQISKIFKSFKI